MVAVEILLDPGVDRLWTYVEPRILGVVARQTPRDLVRRPLFGQPRANGSVQFRTLQLADQRSLSATDDGSLLSDDRRIAAVGPAVALQLAADGARIATQPLGNRLPRMTSRPHLGYGFAFEHVKLRHRWDSFERRW